MPASDLFAIDYPVRAGVGGIYDGSSLDDARGTQFVNRSSVAALAFLLYDILLTMDEEIALMWRKRFSFTTCLYYFIRYYPVCVLVSILFVGTELTPAFHFTPHACFLWQVWQGVASLLTAVAVDVVLVLRVYAMYARARWVFIVLGLGLAAEVVCMSVSLAFALPGIKFDAVCIVLHVPSSVILFAAVALLFQILLFALTLAKLAGALRRPGSRAPLTTLLARDGTWAFGLILFVLALQASLFALPERMRSFIGMFYGWSLVAYSFCGYRVLLNLQHLAPTPAPVPRLSAGASGGSTSADSTTAFTTHFAYESAAAARDDRVWVAQAPEEDYEMHALRPCADA